MQRPQRSGSTSAAPLTADGGVKPGAMNEQEERKIKQLRRRQWKIHIHACWRDEECQSFGAPKRLYINTYIGSLQIERWRIHFHRSHPKREREWLEAGIRSGKVTVLPDGSTLVKLDKPIIVKNAKPGSGDSRSS